LRANAAPRRLDAFKIADDVLLSAVRGVTDLITVPGLINTDFADVNTILRNAGTAIMGVGTSTGEGRAVNAARAAITSPLLEASIDGARGILMNIVGGPGVTLSEITDAANIIHSVAHPDANIIFGSVIDQSIGEAVRVTVIAAGFEHTGAVRQAPLTTSEPVFTEGPRSDIFTNTTNDDFFDVGGDDDLPSFLR
jgi:cell division protein FtsZ